LGETSLLPSIVRGVEAWRFTVLRAASTQSDLVLNCDNGVQVSWEDAGLVVWFHSIQAALSNKAARLTAFILIDFSIPSYSFLWFACAKFPCFMRLGNRKQRVIERELC
jgi:predicted GNAT superfamily acetyltransferase